VTLEPVLQNNEMKPTSHGQDGGSRLISVFCGPIAA
jgi:hypothetical protein